MKTRTISLLFGLLVGCSLMTSAQEDTLKLNWKSYQEPSGTLQYAFFNPRGNYNDFKGNGTSTTYANFFLQFNYVIDRVDMFRVARFEPNLSVIMQNDDGDKLTRFNASPRLSYAKYFRKRRGLHWNINGGYSFQHISQTDDNSNIVNANIGIGIGRLENITEVYQAYRICKGIQALEVNSDLYNEESIMELAGFIRQLRYDFRRDNRRFVLYRNEQFLNYLNDSGLTEFTNFQMASLIDLFNNERNNLHQNPINYTNYISIFQNTILTHQFQETDNVNQGKILRIGVHNSLNTSNAVVYNPAAFIAGYGGKALNAKWHIGGAVEYYNYIRDTKYNVAAAKLSLSCFVNSRARVNLRLASVNSLTSGYRLERHSASLGMSYIINYNTSFNLTYNLTYNRTILDLSTYDVLDNSLSINFAHYII